MKFEINAKKFIKSIEAAIKVSRKGIKDSDFFNVITVKATFQEISVMAFGGEVGINVPISDINISDINYKCEKECTFTVNTIDFIGSLDRFDNQNINITKENKEIVISHKDDLATRSQTVPLYRGDVIVPTIADSFTKEITINREIFIENVKRIFYAIGYEEKRPKYLYWKLLFCDGKVQFIAGTGGRFAISTIKGSAFSGYKDEIEFFFSKNSTPVILDILSNSDCDDIKIKQAIKNKNNVDQIVIDFGGQESIIVGFDPDIDWSTVSLNSILNRDSETIVVTNVSNWGKEIAGMNVTYNEDLKKEHELHNVDVRVDPDKQILHFDINSRLKFTGYVNISKIEKISEDKDMLCFRCHSRYLDEVINNSDSNEDLKFEMSGPSKPVIVRHLPKDNASKGIVEEFVTFFATTKK